MTTLCTLALLLTPANCPKPKPVMVNQTHVLLTVYDPALCPPATECLQGNGDGYFASMIPVSPEWYGRMAACDPEFFGTWVYVPMFEERFYCGDSFGTFDGAPVQTTYEGYTRMDIFWDVSDGNGELVAFPEWNMWVVEVVR